jgi:hypothetical protein
MHVDFCRHGRLVLISIIATALLVISQIAFARAGGGGGNGGGGILGLILWPFLVIYSIIIGRKKSGSS